MNEYSDTELNNLKNKMKIEQLFKILKYNERICITLCYYSNYSVEEILHFLKYKHIPGFCKRFNKISLMCK